MKRFYFRPLFDFYDPFLTFPRRLAAPQWRINIRNQPREYQHEESQNRDDPHTVFERFYIENDLKHQSEKDFFRKYYPEKVEEKVDPYKVLEISKDASLEDVKEAYRKLAIKYHPKENSSPEAQAKFAEVSKAYSTITEPKKSRPFEDHGFNSFFEDFQREIDTIFGNKTEQAKQTKQTKEAKDSKPAKESQKESSDNYGELYSESSHYETVNGQQMKYVIEKIYKKDGKLVSVKREEKLKDDGKVEITEVINNGKEIKKKTFTHENDVKKLNP